MNADQAALRIMLDASLSKAERQRRLAALAGRVRDATRGTMACPSCSARGPHEDNGATGSQLAWLCTSCGEQWDG